MYINVAGLYGEADSVRPSVQGTTAARLEEIRREYGPDAVFGIAATAP